MTLHLLHLLKDWNGMQQRYFLAADPAEMQYYRVCEQLGNWGESRYLLRRIEEAEAAALAGTESPAALPPKESIEICSEQIIRPVK